MPNTVAIEVQISVAVRTINQAVSKRSRRFSSSISLWITSRSLKSSFLIFLSSSMRLSPIKRVSVSKFVQEDAMWGASKLSSKMKNQGSEFSDLEVTLTWRRRSACDRSISFDFLKAWGFEVRTCTSRIITTMKAQIWIIFLLISSSPWREKGEIIPYGYGRQKTHLFNRRIERYLQSSLLESSLNTVDI